MKATKPKRGAPPRAGKPATERIEIRVTKLERAEWVLAAEREELSLSEWLRAAAELAVVRGSTR